MTLMLWSFAALEYDIGARVLREAMPPFSKSCQAHGSRQRRFFNPSPVYTSSLATTSTTLIAHERASTRRSNVTLTTTRNRIARCSRGVCYKCPYPRERLLERVGVESIANDIGDVEFLVRKPSDF